MKLVETLVARDDADVIAAHLAFQLNAGVDFVIAADYEVNDGTTEILESYVRRGLARRLPVKADSPRGDQELRLARTAVAEHGADWVISSDPDEFWWPRGEDIKEVLSVIPPRYSVVQALVRVFPPRQGASGHFWERMTVRPSLLEPAGAAVSLQRALHPVVNARVVGLASDRRVPLRAWYPLEVLRFPLRSPEQTVRRFAAGVHRRESRSALEDLAATMVELRALAERWQELEHGDPLTDGGDGAVLVEDVRLRDLLRTLLSDGSERGVARPLRPPTIVEDAAYAAECAAVGEADLDRLGSSIRDLELRIARLEQRPLLRVRRRLSRLVRR